eukprot:CAMPEP_0184456264 /NCGR_PEP_ID=MMETSP0740-20130409/26249_1 /TAXON_ID=385413 /ORGANISM="Thalassiosira miniscula, Strain CCMP1093" /LENGTH=195 /DNA_ID=CAMNT_0026828337 /DNA_START=118 /DNA_END=705 /DNA_ORIENTATION=-
MYHSNWHSRLFSFALALAATTTPTFAFSSRNKRSVVSKQRGGGGSSSSFATTRRVFCFTLAGSSHTMFSSMRKYSSSGSGAARGGGNNEASSPSSTSLKYRATDEDGCDYWNMSDDESIGRYTDLLWHEAVSASSPMESETLRRKEDSSLDREPLAAPKTKGHGSADGLLETAKAFIPVAVEIGVIAATAMVHLN